MMAARTLYQLVRADVLERTRRYTFLLTVAAAVYLGYLVGDGTMGIHMGGYRGLRNSAWVGMMMELCGVTFVSLAGFYVVKGSVERDRRTGVGQILAATPLGKVPYLAGKTLSNFVVFGVILVILAAAAIVLLLVRGEEAGFSPAALLGPFVVLGFPAMLFIAALATFFETVPWLRHGFGNVVYVFVWTAFFIVPIETGWLSLDVMGLKMPMDAIQADVRAVVHDYNGGFSIGMIATDGASETPFRWAGMAWTPRRIGCRLLPVGYALALVLLASLFFDRFDATARSPAKSSWMRGLVGRTGGGILGRLPELGLRPLTFLAGRTLFGRMLLAELRLMVQGLPWWWHFMALGLWTGSIFSELPFVRAGLLPVLWVWPVFLWSAMGSRESLFRTDRVLFSSPRPLVRQLPALWCAGVLVAAGLASGILARLLLAGDFHAFLAVGVGALLIPSLALVCGVWSGGSKLFEAVYIMAWYVGPMQHGAPLDFMGTTDLSIAVKSPLALILLAGVLFGGALLGRRRQFAAG
jgi:hypothetical protein